jgi:hypothetical protein
MLRSNVDRLADAIPAFGPRSARREGSLGPRRARWQWRSALTAVHTIDLYNRAAPYVDRVLKGEKPADLPVQTPTNGAKRSWGAPALELM